MNFSRLRHPVFWPPFLLLILALVLSIALPDQFQDLMGQANAWVLGNFDWLFSSGSFLMVLVCIAVLFSPLGRVRIGGPAAVPLLSRWRWLAIVICSTAAVGILFWGAAEPIYHLNSPPANTGLEAGSPEAARFSLSTLYLHWSFTPYAIYSIPALMFALAYYNRKRSFGLEAQLFLFLPQGRFRGLGSAIDAISLFALVAGMAASLGTGVLTLSGGYSHLSGQASSDWTTALICIVIVAAFILSASSGLLKGIRHLSVINLWIFIFLAAFFLFLGPLGSIFSQMGEALGTYLGSFVDRSLVPVHDPGDSWSQSWTVFYWSNWMAWAPVTALFLGRIARGYTVREFLLFNWIVPSLFAILWMSILSGSSIYLQQDAGLELGQMIDQKGPESVIYALFENLPAPSVMIGFFLLAAFLSYVTAADSNTTAIGGISTANYGPDAPPPPKWLQAAWGVLIGLVAWIMITFADVEGVKILSTLGGFPALFLLLAVTGGLIYLLFRWKKYFGQDL